VNLDHIDQFVAEISTQDCWFGALDGVNTLSQLKAKISERVYFYRRWVNGNHPDPTPPDFISQSKTNIGEPIARMAECLRRVNVIGDNIPVLIRVDQIEELHKAFTERQKQLLLSFRKLLNRAFASRDARIHYRAGTRRYGWENTDFLGIWGSEAKLENRRDYQLIDMDKELFARGEAKKSNSVFERFSLDAFQKRVEYYYLGDSGVKPRLQKDLAKKIFGRHPNAAGRVEQLKAPHDNGQIDRALALDSAADGGEWSEEWREFLRRLYREGPEGRLNAVLASAWGRQTGGARLKRQHRESPPPDTSPWVDRIWWRKERLDQAVLQLMTRCQQRFMWWGYDDIRSLSGGNITVFLHICHRIWDGFLKNESSLPENRRTDLFNGGTIPSSIQDAGIVFASNEWFNKLTEEPGGNSRKNFVEKLGVKLNDEMVRDLRMAYPGGNGISFALTDYNSDSDEVVGLRRFIMESVGFGVLFESEHSSKSKSSGRRIKFYLNPILCPRFQLPEAKTKEPLYWDIQDLTDLLRKANVTFYKPRQQKSDGDQSLPLFPEVNGDLP